MNTGSTTTDAGTYTTNAAAATPKTPQHTAQVATNRLRVIDPAYHRPPTQTARHPAPS